MSYSVYWTEEAKVTFNENIEHLSINWSLSTISDFLNRVDEVIENIETNPKLYAIYRKKDNVHKCVINKHIMLFYKISSDSKVDLLTFWSTHKNPKKLKI